MTETMVRAYEYIDEAEEWYTEPVAVWPSSVAVVESMGAPIDGPLSGRRMCLLRMGSDVTDGTMLYMPGTLDDVMAELSRNRGE